MSPETLRIDRRFKGVGRIALATGTTNPKIKEKYERMLAVLCDDGRLDILRAIRDRKFTLAEAYLAYQQRRLDTLPTDSTAAPLAVSMGGWIDGLQAPGDVSPKHKRSLQQSLTYLLRGRPEIRVADLPETLERLRGTLGAKHPRSFNLARSAALAFARATLKRSHPLWRAVAAVEPRKVPKTTKRHPLSPEQMRNWFPHPESDPVDAISWGIAVTGMRPNEYFGRWHIRADRVHVIGTKTGGSVRDVPLVSPPAVPAIARRTWEGKVRDRTAHAIAPYDFRRTYANWMEAAGIPRTRRRLYLGHGAGDVTGLYELHEVAAFLVADATAMQRFLGLPSTETYMATPRNARGA